MHANTLFTKFVLFIWMFVVSMLIPIMTPQTMLGVDEGPAAATAVSHPLLAATGSSWLLLGLVVIGMTLVMASMALQRRERLIGNGR